MLYPIIDNKIPHEKRAGINDRIILSLARGKKDITNTEIYNSYTGIGGLHGLDINDFSSYHEYSDAKKSFESGQFFTPHRLCEQMVNLVSPQPNETVLDMCCGMGNFFNHLPNQFNAYGFDIDENAVKVARRLYPDANIEINDIRVYDPGMTFDIIFGNPPFNLDFEGIRSQHFFSHKAYWLLNPGGLMVLVMPMSYLASESGDRTYISMIDRDFSFIGQTKLNADTFSFLGVQNFETKVMAFMRKTDTMDTMPYQPDHFVSWNELGLKINGIKAEKKKLRLKLLREKNMISEGSLESRLKNYKASKENLIDGKKQKVIQKDTQLNVLFKSMSVHEGTRSFDATLEKYLFELKTHKHLQSQYPKAVAYVAKFRSQKPPMNATQDQITYWEKYIRISSTQVLGKLRRIIKRQNIKPEKKYRLVRMQYGYKLKNYNHPFAGRNTDKYVSFIDLVAHGIPLPEPKKMTLELQKEYTHARKVIDRKKKEMLLECTAWKDMKHDAGLDKYIDGLTFVGMKNTECKFSDLQKKDMGLAFQKRYSLLNWQQGSGKTAVLYHFGKYQLLRNCVKNVVIVAPSIAVHMTWEVFLRYNHEDYVLVSRPEQLDNIPERKFIIISVSMLGKIDNALRLFMKKKSQKVCLLFDESDELTNDQALRTKRTLKCFRRAKYKMLGTGTTTRNYISELYPQFQLMYNSSVNFICNCTEIYYEDDKRHIRSKTNNYYKKPFPIRGGAYLFKACFNPGKATVFGIEKHNQDVFNKTALWEIIERAVLTRKFKDFAPDKYTIHSHSVKPAGGENGVYEKVIKEFFSICDLYFNSSPDKKNENSLKIIRQIQLLIKACSVPHTMPGYNDNSLPQKAIYIENMIHNMNEKVAVGCTSLEALNFYEFHFSDVFPDRPLFVVKGDVTFKKRQKLLKEFEKTENGILVCMQQSLKSSVNIPECNEVILESLQWNIPKMEQFYFRFIRFDSVGHTNVHFVNYSDSIEQNIMALILRKEQLNDFISTGEVTEESAVYKEYDISPDIIDSLFRREQDKDGKFHITWGQQKIIA